MQENVTKETLPDKKGYRKVKTDYLNRIRWAVGLLYFAMGLCFATWASRIPDIKTSLALTEADLGTVLFAIPFGQLAIMPFSGRLATKYGSHKTVLIGLVSYILSLVVLGLCTERWQLSLALFFFGISSNLTNISVNTQGIYTEGIFRRPITSAFHGAWSMAGFIGALIGLGMMGLKASPFVHFVCVAILLVIVILVNYKYLVKVKKQPLPQKKKLLSKPDTVLLWLGAMSFCCMLSEGIMFDWSGVYFKEVVQAPGALVVLGYASFMIMMALGRFLGDIAIRKLGRKRVLQLSGCLITVGLLSAVFFPYLITATLAFMMVGIGVSGVVPIIYSVAGKRPGIPPGIALQTISGVSFLGFMLGPPVTGYIAQATSLRVSFAIIAVFGIGIAILATKVRAISEA
ncbi:MFS transporter [Flavobacterium salilacus subsp. salilacus]|uniref:MFS transporter n=1 Tax=Flavobacterium TaxID=237 RepID=UPI001074BE02|nr:MULTISPECIES: MFS transporter [Flavobacterium]KAF2518841.1 MFS transporter [Flavobacterium salilacus subsp. salilacus]MBE1615000.1 MFS transporter [Flavobacterium sp. SaA2.13]